MQIKCPSPSIQAKLSWRVIVNISTRAVSRVHLRVDSEMSLWRPFVAKLNSTYGSESTRQALQVGGKNRQSGAHECPR